MDHAIVYIQKVKCFSFSCRSIKPLAWTIIGGNIVHNFVDGMTLGAAISQRLSLGVSAAIPIAFHEVPHELGELANGHLLYCTVLYPSHNLVISCSV